jgi:hypothetical protein
VAETRREEQKLWLIVFQIKAIRTRLNLLAVQFWLFTTLAVLLGAAVLVYLVAIAFNPLVFLTVAILVCLFAITALVRIARAALAQTANQRRAAAVADERAELKGRLATVLALAAAPPSSPLWPYLVEDTYTLRHKFEPAMVEPRWVSRAIVAPAVAAMLMAALLLGMKYHHLGTSLTAEGLPGEMTADLGNLEIRPADPSQPANVRVYADPATMRQLAAKLAQAEKDDVHHKGVARWMNKARQFAGSLQDQVTGHKPTAMPPLTLKLQGPKSPPAGSADAAAPRTGDQAGNSHSNSESIMPPSSFSGGPANDSNTQRPMAIPPEDADRLAQNGQPSSPSAGSPGAAADEPGPKVGSGYTSAGGSNHSAGSDPEHLFGAPTADQLGSDSFKLSVDARPIDESSNGGSPAYLPPKIRVPLNSEQSPDEPLARTTVPFDDRQTIKRVFER